MDLTIVGDIKSVLTSALKTLKKSKKNFSKSNKHQISNWWEKIQKWRSKRSLDYIGSEETIKPQYMPLKDYMNLQKIEMPLLQLRLVNIKCGQLNIINLINQIDG